MEGNQGVQKIMGIINELKDVFSKRKIIISLAVSDFKKRFVGSYFGVFWMFVQPIVTIVIYYAVFQLGFKSEPPVGVNAPYVFWLIPGIVPWFYFNEAVNMGTGCLFDYNYLVKKVVFKVGILPVIKNVSCYLVHAIFVFIMLVVFMLFGFMPNVYWLQLFYYSFCAFVLILGLTFFSAAINVFFKDMGQIVNILLQFGMWLTPIMWPYTMAGRYGQILKINPVYYITEGFRDCMLNHAWFWQKPKLTIYFWLVTILIGLIGGAVFKKLKPHFADVL